MRPTPTPMMKTQSDWYKLDGMLHGRLLTGIAAVASALAGAGCGKDPAPPTEFVSCAMDPRAEQYTAGMERMGKNNLIKMSLMLSDPAPPHKGTNVWTLRLADAEGADQRGATINVTPWMPDHLHGTSLKANVTPSGADGYYTAMPLYLFMAGLWEVTFDVTTAGGVKDSVVFRFCVDG
jgi:hypothetical protein